MRTFHNPRSSGQRPLLWDGEPVPALMRVDALRPLVAFLQAGGVSPPSMLTAADLPEDLLEDSSAVIPLRFAHRFIEACASSQGIENLGAVVAANTSVFDLAVLGSSLRRAVNVYDYFEIGSRVIGETTSGERFWLTLEGSNVRVNHSAPGRPCIGSIHEDIFAILVTIRALRAFLGQEWSPGEISWLAPDARMLGDLEILGDASLQFRATHSSFTMALELLASPIPCMVTGAHAGAEARAPVGPAMPRSFLEGVEALVVSMLDAGRLSIDAVAEAAGMSTRSLQRHLRCHNCSYSDIVQRSRIRRAMEWLADTGIPVCEIASALGYGDPANFTRAFRRETGVPPQVYRRLH